MGMHIASGRDPGTRQESGYAGAEGDGSEL